MYVPLEGCYVVGRCVTTSSVFVVELIIHHVYICVCAAS